MKNNMRNAHQLERQNQTKSMQRKPVRIQESSTTMTKASTSKRTRPMTAKALVLGQASESRLTDF